MYEQATLKEESTDTEETCPGGETWCDGPDGDALPCFECFLDADEVAAREGM
jgi:hypothetical protein